MNKKEAIHAMLDGKKVTRNDWTVGYRKYVLFNIDNSFIDNTSTLIDMNRQFDEEWEIYKEPKKKVKMYKWAVQWHNRSYPENTHHYYRDESEVPTGCNVIKRLDYTEIEVEVKG